MDYQLLPSIDFPFRDALHIFKQHLPDGKELTVFVKIVGEIRRDAMYGFVVGQWTSFFCRVVGAITQLDFAFGRCNSYLMPLHVEGAGFHLAAPVMEHEVRKLLGEQGGKRTDHFDGQTLAGRRHGTEHQRQLAVDAIGVEDCQGVADHLSLKIMYLLAYDT